MSLVPPRPRGRSNSPGSPRTCSPPMADGTGGFPIPGVDRHRTLVPRCARRSWLSKTAHRCELVRSADALSRGNSWETRARLYATRQDSELHSHSRRLVAGLSDDRNLHGWSAMCPDGYRPTGTARQILPVPALCRRCGLCPFANFPTAREMAASLKKARAEVRSQERLGLSSTCSRPNWCPVACMQMVAGGRNARASAAGSLTSWPRLSRNQANLQTQSHSQVRMGGLRCDSRHPSFDLCAPCTAGQTLVARGDVGNRLV